MLPTGYLLTVAVFILGGCNYNCSSHVVFVVFYKYMYYKQFNKYKDISHEELTFYLG